MDNIPIDFKSLLQVAKEFIRALGKKRTYNLFENWYCIFGILWGIPVPIVTIGIYLYASHQVITAVNIAQTISSDSSLLFFLFHPVLFGIVFGAMGTVRYNKEQEIKEFEKNLINKNLELENMNKKLQELDQLKSNFLSMVSHELRTPLTTIQGYVSFLLTEKPGAINKTQRDCLKVSEDTTDTLNRLIEDLLDLSKIESKEFKVNPEGLDMAEIINKAVSSLKILADAKEITLDIKLPKDLPLVLADKERMLQVITNLIGNAIKFNHRQGRVEISPPKCQENEIVFCVSDTGIGIAKDKLEKVFEKFYQVDSSRKRKYGGCGLGLAITKSIIELHQGKIWIESEIGSGSKFFFTLPRKN